MKLIFRLKAVLTIVVILIFSGSLSAQLVLNTTSTPTQIVQNDLVGSGVSVSNVTFQGYSCNTAALCQLAGFSNGATTNLGLNSGIVMASGDVHNIPNPASGFMSDILNGGGDPQLDAISGNPTFDAAVLQFDFVPQSAQISFSYVFGSEEYLEYVGSPYNDAFGFFVSGPNPSGGTYNNMNIALVPGTATPVTINNVNTGSWSIYYVNNEGIGGGTIVFDGFTTVLTATCNVVPCQSYHIKLAIADAGDYGFDSGVFIKENSFSTASINIDVTYSSGTSAGEGCSYATVTVSTGVAPGSPLVVNYTVSGTATNGVDFPAIPSSVTIPAGNLSTSFTINPTLDGITEGTETVIFALPNPCGGFSYDTVYISDNTLLTVNAGNDQTLCQSALPATLTATPTGGVPTYNYNWNNGAGSGATVNVSPGSTTIYEVTATDACGQTSTDQVTVNVTPNPTSTFTAVTPICENDSSAVQYTGNAGPGATYNWNFNGATVLSGSGQGPYNITWGTAGTYNITLTVTENGCTSTQSSQSVTVYAAGSPQCCTMPTPNAGPDASYCSLSATLQGVASTAGVWTSNPPTAVFSNPASPTSNVTVPSDGSYQFTWTEAPNPSCTANDVVTITFNQQPVANSGPGGQTCSNAFNLNAVPTYGTGTWTSAPPAGVTFSSPGSPSTSVTVSNDGVYVFTWSEDNNGCFSSANAQVFFTAQPVANAGPDMAYCQLTADLQATPSVGTGTWTVLSGGNLTFSSVNLPTANIIAGISGTFTLVWTENNGNGCIDSDTVTIQLTQTPTSDFTATAIACTGNASAITYTGNGNSLCTYTWNFSGGNAIPGTGMGPHSVTWLSAGNQTVSLTVSQNGCSSSPTNVDVLNPTLLTSTISGTNILCNGQTNGTATLTPSGGTQPYQYQWNYGPTTQSLQGIPGGIYTVTVTDDNGCTTFNGVTVNEPDQFIISTNPNHSICYGQPAYLSVSITGGTGPAYSYIWSDLQITPSITVYPMPPSETYSVTATDANGCSSTASVTISVSLQININLIANTDSICPGEPVMLTPVISGGVGPPYMIINQNGTVVTPPIYVYPETTGLYWVSVKDACGTSSADSVYLYVLPLPAANAYPDSLAGCQPFTVHFNEVNPEEGRTFVWNFGDNENLSLAKNPVHTFTRPGVFNVTLTVTSNYGCKATYNICSITVWPQPNAQFVWTPDITSVLKPVVNFTNMTTGGQSYIWTFGDGDSTNTVNPVHRFPGSGDWAVELIAISNLGCRDTVMYPITIQEEWTFYAPSAFTPDFDKKNDFFFITAHGIKKEDFYLAIYDRWGEVIWDTSEYDEISEVSEKWDGSAKNNELVQVGTYNWFAKFKDFNGVVHEKTGGVTIIR